MAFQFPASPAINQVFTPASGVSYKWNGTGWVLMGVGTNLLPSGIILPFASPTTVAFLPTGFLVCNGASYATAAYPALYTAIGYQFGGAGPNFNVPDLRGRVLAGLDGMGAALAGRLTSTVTTPNTLGGIGGSEAIVLTTPQLAAHTHAITGDPGHSHSYADPGHFHTQYGSTSTGAIAAGATVGDMFFTNSGTSLTGITIGSNTTGITATDSTGTGASVLNLQPTIVLNFIIKT